MKANKEARHENKHNIRVPFKMYFHPSYLYQYGKDMWYEKEIFHSLVQKKRAKVLKYRNTKQCECFSFRSLARSE